MNRKLRILYADIFPGYSMNACWNWRLQWSNDNITCGHHISVLPINKDILVSWSPPLFKRVLPCVLGDIYRDFGAIISLTNKKLAEGVTH